MKRMFASLALVLCLTAFAGEGKPPVGEAVPIERRDTIPAVTTTAPVTPPGTGTNANVQTNVSTPGGGNVQTNTSLDVEPAIPGWMKIVLSGLMVLWTTLLLPWLQSKVAQQKAQASLHQIDMNTSLLTQRKIIFDNVLAYVSEHALAIAQRNFPLLAQDILEGKFRDPHFIRAELAKWTDEIKNDTINYFKSGGIDLLAVIGEKALVELINAAASKVSPFPGKDIAVELLDDKVVPLLLNYGVDWVRKYYLGNHSDTEINLAKGFGHLPEEKSFPMTWKRDAPAPK